MFVRQAMAQFQKFAVLATHTRSLNKTSPGKCAKCQERGCKSHGNIVYNNNNGCVHSCHMSGSGWRVVHVSLPSHGTVSEIYRSGYTCSIFEQSIRAESAPNAKTVAASFPRISFITTEMATFKVAACLVVDHGWSGI